MLIRLPAAGFSLIELMIALAVLGMLLFVGLPNLTTWLQNTHIRTAAEAVQSGLQLTRAEALRRNALVRFQLVTNLTAGCALSSSGTSWVVSLANPAGACNVNPSDTTAPQIIQKRAGSDGSRNAAVAATGGSSIVFNGLGRAPGATLTQIDISNPNAGVCQTAGPMRCLRLVVNTGGIVRMCDPAVADNTDPRFC